MAEMDAAARSLNCPAELQGLRDGVLHVLRHVLRDKTMADDLCNETFRVVLERLRQQPLEEPEKLAPFLAQTARLLARNAQRAEVRRRTFTGQQQAIDEFGDPEADPSAVSQAQARTDAVQKILAELPTVRDREILVRVYLRDEDKDQVCRDLGIDDAHFRRVVFRARERFKALLDKRYRAADLYCFAVSL
jgi:RNA polymerase sigma-70 factor (ECF subfamily)